MGRPKADNPRDKFVAVWCTAQEKERIKEKAEMCGTKSGPFIRDLSLEYPLRSMVDQYALDQLLQARADLGRLGGLFKLWLTKNENYKDAAKIGDRNYESIECLVDDIEAKEEELIAVAKELMKAQN